MVGANGIPKGNTRHATHKSKSVYFAGALFTAQEIVGNQALADAIQRAGRGRYRLYLPQNQPIEQSHAAVAIRQADLAHVVAADVFLGNFNGPDLDSGTVAEFVTAKLADKPAVLLHTDFRVLTCLAPPASGACPSAAIPFNSVLIGWPRTELVAVDALAFYTAHQFNVQLLLRHIASLVVAAMDRVSSLPRLFPANALHKDALNAILSSKCSVQASSTPCNATGVTILGTGQTTKCVVAPPKKLKTKARALAKQQRSAKAKA